MTLNYLIVIIVIFKNKGVIMNKCKWYVLRALFIVALTFVYIGTFVVAKHYHYPVEWLLHYLKGSGKAKEVPPYLFQKASGALAKAIRDNVYGDDIYRIKSRYCVYHSTLYEGSGFADRPSLFYLVGGFSFTLIKPKWLWDREGWFLVSGHDVYDWHANEQGFYFDSPLGNSGIMKVAVTVLSWIYGKEYFHISEEDGVNMGNACLSNKLWETFSQYGAKEFTSYWENVAVDLGAYDWMYPDYYEDDDYEDYDYAS